MSVSSQCMRNAELTGREGREGKRKPWGVSVLHAAAPWSIAFAEAGAPDGDPCTGGSWTPRDCVPSAATRAARCPSFLVYEAGTVQHLLPRVTTGSTERTHRAYSDVCLASCKCPACECKRHTDCEDLSLKSNRTSH